MAAILKHIVPLDSFLIAKINSHIRAQEKAEHETKMMPVFKQMSLLTSFIRMVHNCATNYNETIFSYHHCKSYSTPGWHEWLFKRNNRCCDCENHNHYLISLLPQSI